MMKIDRGREKETRITIVQVFHRWRQTCFELFEERKKKKKKSI